MKTKALAILLMIFTFVGCKNEKKEEVKIIEEKSNSFTITLNATVIKDDSFHIYYNEDGSANFTEENSVWAEFKGSNSPQKITFKLPEDVYPNQLRIDFGVNKNQENIIFNNISFLYNDNNLDMNWEVFLSNFWPNELNTKIDRPAQTIIPIKSENYFGPSFYPTESLKTSLLNIGKKQ